jgi:hypothetical protein
MIEAADCSLTDICTSTSDALSLRGTQDAVAVPSPCVVKRFA